MKDTTRQDVKRICNYIVRYGTQHTLSGNRHFDFSEIERVFGIHMDKKTVEAIADALYEYEEVQEVDTCEDFDVMFFLKHCPHVEDCDSGEPGCLPA